MPPAGSGPRLDLRPIPAMASKSSIPQGNGLFVVNGPAPPGTLDLGQSMSQPLSTAQRRDFEARFDLADGDLDAPTLLDALWRLMTELADPTGANRMTPLTPNSRGEIELRLRGVSLRREKYTAARHPQVLQFARNRYASRSYANNAYLIRLAKKLGVRPQDIAVPRGGATVQDTFDVSSDTALGSHTPTPGGSGSWTVMNGSWTVHATSPADAAAQTTVTDHGTSRLNLDLDSDDMTVTGNCSMQISFDAVGVLGRVASDAEDYIFYSHDASNTDSHELATVVAGGTPTQIDTLQSTYHAHPWTEDLILELDGTSAICTEATTERLNNTVGSTWDGNVRVGIYMDEAISNSGPYVNQIDGEDIGGGGVASTPTRMGLTGVGI